MKTLYWHDYETFGLDPKLDRPSQFAGVRTNENLEVIEDPLVLYCQPALDYLPTPESVLITGITPQNCVDKGIPEQQFAAKIHEQFSRPDTCVVGYNNIRFDDEFTRFMLYRNLYDPYEREWKNGNSRWDIIDMLRMARALRPEGIIWPNYEDGTPSFRLEDLTSANGLDHDNAHDALSDVMATIELAKLLRQAQPKLYNYLYQLRDKRKVAAMLTVDYQTVLVHTSSKYSLAHGKTALVMPLAMHPVNKNGVVVYDLSLDPQPLIDLPVDEIKHRLFMPRELLPEGQQPIPIKTIHINRSPAVAPLSTMSIEAFERLKIDRKQAQHHFQMLQKNLQVQQKIVEIFAPDDVDRSPDDVDQQLYTGGFCSRHDKYQLQTIRGLRPDQHGDYQPEFDDLRYEELYFRYRARNFSESLTGPEQNKWLNFCREKLLKGNDVHLGLEFYFQEISRLESSSATGSRESLLLYELNEYAKSVESRIFSRSG
ncbi:MAG: exodeoxyribonuclease I [Pseudomonadales bacterium]|nr:exodeoxyribonuclease I [Pseudomonadales bacterium]